MTLERADAVVSIGRFTTTAFEQLHPKLSLIEIPNGVALDQLSAPVERPAGLDARIEPGSYVLFLGRLHPRKGTDLLIDAWARQAGGSHEMLVVAGSGDQLAALVSQARWLGVEDRVRFVGQVQARLNPGCYRTPRASVCRHAAGKLRH